MILQSLCNYYARMARDPGSGMPRRRFSAEKIDYALLLRPDGSLAGILNLQETRGKKTSSRIMAVPAAEKRTVGISPNFLWDNTGYVLGVDGKGKPERTARCFAAFKALHQRAAREHPHPKLQAVASFLEGWDPACFDALPDVDPKELVGKNCVFFWHESNEAIHDDPDIVHPALEGKDTVTGRCLVSGQIRPLARLHPSIKGVWGGQSAGGSIVSFNLDAFTSYGKEQSYNAPVAGELAEAYVSALNYLLNRDNRRCLQIGDASTVFWAEKHTPAEDLLYTLLSEDREDSSADETRETPEAVQTSSPEAGRKSRGKRSGKPPKPESREESFKAGEIREFLISLKDGAPLERIRPDIDPSVRFFILGLAPNAARISIRFWLVSTFGELARNIERHYKAIAIERRFASDPPFPSQRQLMLATAARGKAENILPPLAAEMARAILTGAPYPQNLLQSVISRIRADKRVSYPRAALIKGCLVRTFQKEIPVMLDETRTDTPYLLGRLFSLMEKAQLDALGNVNAGIRDRFIGSASATPGVVFPRLLRVAQHHLAKSEYRARVEKAVQAVMQGLSAFPAHLSLEEQGTFFIGYYHQTNANYKATAATEE